MALVLLSCVPMALAQGYASRPYSKKPHTELSSKSRKGIERIIGGESAPISGETARGNQAVSQAKADTERHRLEQERALSHKLNDPDSMDDTPPHMRRAMQAYLQTGDRNIKRFAEAVSEFQLQEFRARALLHIDDPEKFNRHMAVISGKPFSPYASISDSGYVVNKSTGEISIGNPRAADIHDKKTKADTARKNAGAASQYARTKERENRAASQAAAKNKAAASPGLTEGEYQAARARAIELGRPNLARELDDFARQKGYKIP